jgi:hypothetical protein
VPSNRSRHLCLRKSRLPAVGKRPFLARGLGLDAYWLPVPGQEFVEAAGGKTVGHALQDVSEPGSLNFRRCPSRAGGTIGSAPP